MRYEFLTSTEHALFDAAFDLHELSFPPAFRRSRESFARAFSDPDFECIAFRESQAVMGYATRWFLPDAVYLESIVVAPEFRGLGLGRQHLREIVATSRKPVAALVADELPDALAFFLKKRFSPERHGRGRPALPAGCGQGPLCAGHEPPSLGRKRKGDRPSGDRPQALPGNPGPGIRAQLARRGRGAPVSTSSHSAASPLSFFSRRATASLSRSFSSLSRFQRAISL